MGLGDALIKLDIINEVVNKTGITKTKAEMAVETVFGKMKRALEQGDRIELRGFGVFTVKPRKTGKRAGACRGRSIIMGAVGRTDLPDSDPAQLDESIRKVMALPPETHLLPGHGEPSTLGQEREDNLYVRNALGV